MIKSELKRLHEANCERGNSSRGGRLVETGESMDKKRIEGRRGGRAGTTQRSERSDMTTRAQSTGSSRGGKCDDCAGKQRVLTWGDPKEEMPWEVSRSHSSGSNKPGVFSHPYKLGIPEILMTMKGRTEEQSPDRVADGTDVGADQSASSESCAVRKHEEADAWQHAGHGNLSVLGTP